MNIEELHNKLQQSERKRSQLVVELGHARLELRAAAVELQQFQKIHGGNNNNGGGGSGNVALGSTMLSSTERGSSPNTGRTLTFNTSPGGGGRAYESSPAGTTTFVGVEQQQAAAEEFQNLRDQLAKSEKERVLLSRELAKGVAGSAGATSAVGIGIEEAPTGTMSILPVEDAADADFAFAEEEEARAAAEDLMAQLLHLKRSLHLTRTELAEVRMELTEQVSVNDAAKSREVAMAQIVDQYQSEIRELLAIQRAQDAETLGAVQHNVDDQTLLDRSGGAAGLTSSAVLHPFSVSGGGRGGGPSTTQGSNDASSLAVGQAPKLVLGAKVSEEQVRKMEKSNHDLTEALEKMQEELLIEKSKRKMLEDEVYKMRVFMQQGYQQGSHAAAAVEGGPTFLSSAFPHATASSTGLHESSGFNNNGSLSSKGMSAAGDLSFSVTGGGGNGRSSVVEDELRSQVTSLTATYSKQLDHCRLQDDMIKKLRDALKQKIARIKELETLIKAQLQANPALLSLASGGGEK